MNNHPLPGTPLVLLVLSGSKGKEHRFGGVRRDPPPVVTTTNHLCTLKTGKALHLLEPSFFLYKMEVFMALLSWSLYEARITNLGARKAFSIVFKAWSAP